jgi:hypothetical protein
MASPEQPLTDGATERGTRPGAGGNGAPDGETRGEAREVDWEAIAARLFERLAEVLREVRTLVSVSSEGARLRLRRARWGLMQGIVLGLAGAALALAGAVYLARGLAGTLAVLLGGRPWLGELVAGLLLLALAAGGLALARARDERAELERLRRKYAREDDEDHEDPEERRSAARTRAEDAGGAARAGAETGALGARAEPRRSRP